MRYRIGCQSWQYEDWITPVGEDPVFYPRGTRPPEMLSLYARVFNTIEVDSTAYGTPARSTIAGWLTETPGNFQFSLKVPRAITHEASLGPESYSAFDEFVDAARGFRSRLGVILIQLPAAFEPARDNGQNLRHFLSRLPEDFRFAIEFRHRGWFVDWTLDELNGHRVALALVAGKWIPEAEMFSAFERVRTEHAYVRFMGVRDLPRFDRVYRDRTDELRHWTARMTKLTPDEVYIYVDNYFEGHAPATANKIKRMLNIDAVDAGDLEVQPSLF